MMHKRLRIPKFPENVPRGSIDKKFSFNKRVLVAAAIIFATITAMIIVIGFVDWESMQKESIPGAGSRTYQLVPGEIPPSEEYQPLTMHGWTDKIGTIPAYIPATVNVDGKPGFKSTTVYHEDVKMLFPIDHAKEISMSWIFQEAPGSARETIAGSFQGFEFVDATGNVVFRVGFENTYETVTLIKWYSSSGVTRVDDMGHFTTFDKVKFTVEYDHGHVTIVPVKLTEQYSTVVQGSLFDTTATLITGVQFRSDGIGGSYFYSELSLQAST